MIEFNNVSMKYPNGTKALKNVDIRIEQGEFVFVVGASGAGKSTFLKLMMREETPSEGEIIINNYNLNKIRVREIPYFRRTLGIVFQDFRLIPSMSVFNNVAFAMRVIGAREKEISKRVAYTLSLVGLSSKARMLPSQLSGGEQQRVAMARALVNNAGIIIADEPTGNIDPEMSYEIVDLLNHINANGTTVVMVTHEHALVREFDKRVITIRGGSVISDTTDTEQIALAIEESSGQAEIPSYYEAPNESVDVEEFLKNYGREKEKTPQKRFSRKERKAENQKSGTPPAPGALDTGNISTPGENGKKDYSVYFEPPENSGKDGEQE